MRYYFENRNYSYQMKDFKTSNIFFLFVSEINQFILTILLVQNQNNLNKGNLPNPATFSKTFHVFLKLFSSSSLWHSSLGEQVIKNDFFWHFPTFSYFFRFLKKTNIIFSTADLLFNCHDQVIKNSWNKIPKLITQNYRPL